jgi:hypothetical protein
LIIIFLPIIIIIFVNWKNLLHTTDTISTRNVSELVLSN